MDVALRLLSEAVTGPIVLLYLLFLNDRWRVGAVGGVGLALSMLVLRLALALLLPEVPMLRALLFWGLVFPPVLSVSALKGTRFLFVFFSALLVATLSAVVAALFSWQFGLSALFFRLPLDGILLLLCHRFFTPVFRPFLHTVDRGWGLLILFPISLWSFFFLVLNAPGLDARCAQSYTRVLIYLLGLFAIMVYLLMFQFFRLLRTRQETALSADVLHAQRVALEEHMEHWRVREERQRILRHDMRHRITILRNYLAVGDAQAALGLTATIRTDLETYHAAPEEAAEEKGGEGP